MATNVRNVLQNSVQNFERIRNPEYSQRKVSNVLQGMQEQVNAFIQTIEDFMQQESLEKINSKITECTQCLDIGKRNLNKELNFLSTKYSIHLNIAKQIFKYNDQKLLNEKKIQSLAEALKEKYGENNEILNGLTYEKKQGVLKELRKDAENYIDDEKQHEEIAAKLNRMKTKIKLKDAISKIDPVVVKKLRDHLMLRIKNAVSQDYIATALKQSQKNDELNKQKNYQLKEVWSNTIYHYRNLKDTVERLQIKLEAIPRIEKLSNELPNDYFTKLIEDLEKISAFNLSKGFNKDYKDPFSIGRNITRADEIYKRKFFEYFTAIKNYVKDLESYAEKEKALARLNQSFLEIKPFIVDSLRNISISIQSIEERKTKNFDLSDKEMTDKLLYWNEESIRQLKALKNDIITKWNSFCLNLYTTNRQHDCFIKTKAITEKMGWCYYLAEEIYQDLRNLQETEDISAVAAQVIKLNIANYDKLCKIIFNTNEQNQNEKYLINIFDCFFDYAENKIIGILTNEQIANLNILNEKISNQKSTDLETEHNNFNISINLDLNCLNGPSKYQECHLIETENEKENAENFNSFLAKKRRFDEALQKYDKNINETYTTILPDMRKLALDKINLVGTTLRDIKDPYYKDHFTKAFTYSLIHGIHVAMETTGYIANSFYNLFSGPQENEQQKKILDSATFDFVPLPFELKSISKGNKEYNSKDYHSLTDFSRVKEKQEI